MSRDPTLWQHFILAASVSRLAAGRAEAGAEAFRYIDTHAGSGALPPPPRLDRVSAAAGRFSHRAYFDAVGGDRHPGSWVMAGRAITAAAPGLELEMDVNDIDEEVIAEARRNREAGWVRFWGHDWFLFLRSRLGLPGRPDFVFIDPPADDPRGPAYAIDAAILLDQLGIPYMVTYPAADPQQAVDQIGRTGLELAGTGLSAGALLGGGAETVLLHLLPDLHRLAALLDAEFAVRLPRSDDYCI